MTIPDDLLDDIQNRECLIFVGSGMSKEAGLPSADDLTEVLINRLSQRDYTPSSQ